VIIRESDKIFGGIGGFVITSADNIMAPNAGIDKSNAKRSTVQKMYSSQKLVFLYRFLPKLNP